MSQQHVELLIIGAGAGGLSIAAHLLNAGVKDVAVIEPSENC